jgi:hypothetical protein
MKKPNELIPFTNAERKLIEKIVEKRVSAERRFPFVITLMVAFGLVSTFYGFEKIIDRIDLFANNPWILLVTGLTLLAVTGTIYKKLS